MWGEWLDSAGLERFYQKLKGVFVQKDGSKVLSTNDYTTTEKNKLAGIASGAEVNKIDAIQTNGTTLSINNKTVNIPLMTGATSSANSVAGLVPVATSANRTKFLRGDGTWQEVSGENTTYTLTQDATDGHKIILTPSTGTPMTVTIPDNDTKVTVDSSMSSSSTNPVQNKVINSALGNKANLASPTFTGTPKSTTATAGDNSTRIATTAFVKTAIDNAIGGVIQFRYSVVETLPSTGVQGTIYLIAHTHGTQDKYDEYIYVNNTWEKIGNTDIDLSEYAKLNDLANYALIQDLSNISNATIDNIVV